MKFLICLLLISFIILGSWKIYEVRPIINIGEPPEQAGYYTYNDEVYVQGLHNLKNSCYEMFNCIYTGADRQICAITKDGRMIHCSTWPAEQDH